MVPCHENCHAPYIARAALVVKGVIAERSAERRLMNALAGAGFLERYEYTQIRSHQSVDRALLTEIQ